MSHKICFCCKKELSIDNFYKCKQKKDGYAIYCKVCIKLKRREKDKTLTEEQLIKRREVKLKDYYKHKNKRINKHRQWTTNNPEKSKNSAKNYSKNHRKDINERVRNRKKNDPSFKIRAKLHTRICDELRGRCRKNFNTIELIGCSSEELVKYIESLFLPGMHWKNQGNKDGTWQLDHILPCCSFDLTKEDEQRKCFHWSNLRPMWYKDHRIKSGYDKTYCAKLKRNLI